jgi:hypothetical protein
MIWYSADDRQAPVKIESKVSIGTFGFELVSATFYPGCPITPFC